MGVHLRWLTAIAIFAAGTIWVHFYLGWPRVFSAWQDVSPSNLIVLLGLTFVSYGLRAQRISRALPRRRAHPFHGYLRISLIHNALNNLLPMRLGEASLPIMARRDLGVGLVESTATLLLLRLMDLHFLMVVLCVSLLPVSALIGVSGIAVLLATTRLWPRLYPHVRTRLPKGWQTGLQALQEHHQQRSLTVELYTYTATVWLSKLLALVLLILSFLDIRFYQGVMAVISADLSSVLPIHGLAGSGTFESAIVIALAPFELDNKDIISAAINVHLYVLIASLSGAAIALLLPSRRNHTAVTTP